MKLAMNVEPPAVGRWVYKNNGNEMPATKSVIANPGYNIIFCRGEKQIGVLDFNGPAMMFEGDIEDSARIFFDQIARLFAKRLEEERTAEREACDSLFNGSDKEKTMWDFVICVALALINLPGAMEGSLLSIASMVFCSCMAMFCMVMALTR